MPKRKPSKASSSFFVHAHTLSDASKSELLRLLAYDESTLRDAEYPGYRKLASELGAALRLQKNPDYVALEKDPFQAIRDVELALGLYVDGGPHIDNVPRPADYRDTFRPIGRSAFSLMNAVTELSNYYREQFSSRGKDVHKIESSLKELVDVCAAVTREFGDKPSKGAPKQAALCEVIRRLRSIFRDYYQGPREGRAKRGAFQSRAKWEKDEADFVEAALCAARIVRKPFRELARLFRDSRCALVEDRAATVARIARKVHSARLREQKRKPK